MQTHKNDDLKNPTPQGTFLLGLGVQKAGTSWLYDYLSSSSQSDLGIVKEYHVWDLREKSNVMARKSFLETMSQRYSNGIVNRRFASSSLRSAFIHNPSIYFDYFEDRLWRPHTRLTGDITPSYSMLSAPVMRKIRDEFRDRGIPVRAILILRDPVMRLRSMLRMFNRERNLQMSAGAEFEKMIEMQQYPLEQSRSNYRGVIERAKSVFGKRLLILFYEDLFTKSSTEKICLFLNIDYIDADLTKRVNATTKSSKINSKHYQVLSLAYKEEMHFMRDYFGAARMEKLWPDLNSSHS